MWASGEAGHAQLTQGQAFPAPRARAVKPLEPGALGADSSVDRSHTLGGPHRAQLTRGAWR